MNTNSYYKIIYYIISIIIIMSIMSYFFDMENFSGRGNKRKRKNNRRIQKNIPKPDDMIPKPDVMIPKPDVMIPKPDDMIPKPVDIIPNTGIISCRTMGIPRKSFNDFRSLKLDNYNIGCWKDENLKGFSYKKESNEDIPEFYYQCCGNKDSLEPSNWKCSKAGSIRSIRKNSQGNIECASNNESDCIEHRTEADCNEYNYSSHKDLKPLSCGEIHKKKFGYTGYDIPDNWCSVGYQELLNPNVPKQNIKLNMKTDFVFNSKPKPEPEYN